MAKKTYDNRTINVFPEELKITLPDGYRMDIEYDEDGEQIVNLRGGFSFNDEGEEVAGFSAVFIRLNSEINDRQKSIEDGTLREYFVPGLMLKQVADGVFENLKEQLGPGKRFDMFGSFPASTIMKFYKPISIFGVNIETYIVMFLIEITENVHFGFQSVYQNSEGGNRKFFKHVLNIMKSFRVNGEAVDTGKLTPKKLEQILDMEVDTDVEALDLGLKIDINFKNGDEETHYTINSDGSITEDSSDSGYYDSAIDDEPHYDQSVLDGPLDTLRIGDSYDPAFLKEHGKDIRRIVASGYGYVNYITMASCPNVEEFIVRKNSVFTFENGVLYSKNGNKRTIEYITKNVEHLHIDADVSDISSYWHGVKKVTVDPGNGNFVAQGNMLLSRRKNSLYFVTADAEEVIIPEGVTQIHAHAIEYCDKLKKISFPSTYEWKEWYGSHSEPLLYTRDGVKPPKIIVNDRNIRCENGLVLRYPDTRPNALLYLGDYENCYIPAKLTSTFGFDGVFKKVKNFTVDKDNPELASVEGVILDKGKTKLLFYPPARDEFIVPATVKEIASHSAASRDFTEIVIPEHVQKVGQMAFANCMSLRSVKTLNPNTEIHKEAYLGCHQLNGTSMFEPVNEDELKKSLAEEIWEIDHSQDKDDSFGGFFGWQQEEAREEVRFSGDSNRTVIVDDKWAFDLPDGVYLRFDSEHVDIMGNSTTAKYVVEGLEYNGRFFFDFDLHERFEDGMSTDVDVIGCRHDNDVISGNAQQKILLDGDDLFVDLVSKPVFFFNSMAMIRVRGDGMRSWDFTAGLSSTDQEMSARWEEVQGLMKELAGSIRLLDGTASSAKKKKTKKEDSASDPDFIISNGVLRKYIGKSNDVVIPDGVKEIADSTFSGFSKLKSVVVPEGVKRIGRRCFENCTSLEHAYLPDSLEELGGYAFVDCHELKEVYLSEKLNVLGDSAFSECFKLKDVKIPKNIDIIDAFVFKNCREFRHIVIPDKVEKIGFSAFVACTNLEYLFVPESVKECQINISSHPFEASERLTIYTPAGSFMQKFAEENGIPYKNADKGTVTADNSAAKVAIDAKPSKVSRGSTTSHNQINLRDWGFTSANVDSKKKKLINNDEGFPIRILPCSEILRFPSNRMASFQYYCTHHSPAYNDKVAILLKEANKFLTLFSKDGTDLDIKCGKLRNSAPIHALRSFIWTAVERQEVNKRNLFPVNAPCEMWIALAEFIGSKGYANYRYVKKEESRFGALLMNFGEVMHIYEESVGPFLESDYSNRALGKTMSRAGKYSLVQLVDILIEIMPVMDILYNNLNGQADGVDDELAEHIKTIIKGWTVYAYASKQPFFVIPGDRYPIEIDPDTVPNWAEAPQINDYQDGLFTAFGKEIVSVNNTIQERIVQLPEGITGIVITDDNKEKIDKAFVNVKKIIYPASYSGRIVVPGSVEEIVILGDIECLKISDIAIGKSSELREIEFKGKVGEIGDLAFSGLGNLRTLRLPEGITLIGTYAFSSTKLQELYLPESVEKLVPDAFDLFPTTEGTTIYVYETCPALSKIQKQFEKQRKEHAELNKMWRYSQSERPFALKLKILESPWATRAKLFLNKISLLYDKKDLSEIGDNTVQEILTDTIGGFENFEKCRHYIIADSRTNNFNSLKEVINNTPDNQQAYSSVPERITADIRQSIEKKNREEKERKLNEIKTLSQSNSMSDLKRAISMLEEFKEESADAEALSKQCTSRLESIREEKYVQAVSLAEECTVDSIKSALLKMEAISPYKDSSSKIIEWNKLLNNEEQYVKAVSSMYGADISSLIITKGLFDKLGDYKDSIIKAAACEKYINELCEKIYQEARLAEGEYSIDSQVKAIEGYKRVGNYKDASDRIAVCNSNIVIIEEYLELKEKLENHKKELGTLNGFFKRRQRQEKEEQIKQIEQQLEALSSKLVDA